MLTDDLYARVANEVTADEAERLTRALIDIPSPTGSELACATFLAAYMADAGVETEVQRLDGERANVIARVPGERPGPALMLNGHLDTTFTGDPAADYAVTGGDQPNDRPRSFMIGGGIFGLGAFNMKGGVAASFLALRAFQRAGVRPPGDLLASGVAGESEKAPVAGVRGPFDGPAHTGSGYGTARLLQLGRRIDYAIVAEPSDLFVVNAQAGFLFLRCRIAGRLGYVAPLLAVGAGGSDALAAARRVIESLADWGTRYTAANAFETGLGTMRPQVTLGAIESGWPFFPSLAPAVCHLYLSVRLTPAQDPGAVLEDVRHHLASGLPDVDCQVEVFADNTPGTITPADTLLCRTAIRVMKDTFGLPTVPFRAGEADASNDTNRFRRAGIPTIKCGPQTRLEPDAAALTGRHGPHVHVDDIVTAARFYIRMALELGGAPGLAGGSP